jgi:predicted PurR-regulated permease PerM
MTLRQQLIFWLATFVVFIFLLWLLSDVLLPFIAGLALAYLQAPLVDRLQRAGVNRTVAALLVVGVVVAGLILIMLLLIPLLVEQLTALASNMPAYIARLQTLITEIPWLRRFVGDGDSSKTIQNFVSQSSGWLTGFLASLWTGSKAAISFLSLLVVMPVVTFYLLVDWHGLVETLDSWIPRQHHAAVHAVVREIDRVISGFVRGQSGVCLILGAFYAISLSLVGLHFGWVIGLMSGLLTFIPYVGSMSGLVLAVSVAVVQFWPDWTWMAVVLGICCVGQFLEGNVLVPNLVGKNVGLHPVLLMFAMFAFGYLFGFVGLLVAVPLAATIGVLFRFALAQYFASPYYTGEKTG